MGRVANSLDCIFVRKKAKKSDKDTPTFTYKKGPLWEIRRSHGQSSEEFQGRSSFPIEFLFSLLESLIHGVARPPLESFRQLAVLSHEEDPISMSILKSFHVLDSGLVQKSLERFAFAPQDEFWRNVAGDACVAVFGITPAGGGGAGQFLRAKVSNLVTFHVL